MRFAADEPIVLDADVKHVPELVVKVFRIDPLAYFQHHRREVNTDLDLDGLAASHELSLRFPEPPVRRVRRRIELPMCARAGTYVVDLIGNGIASRAVVHQGPPAPRERASVPRATSSRCSTSTDGRAPMRARGSAIASTRADDQGTFVVPFSTAPGLTPMLLAHGDIATVAALDLQRETLRAEPRRVTRSPVARSTVATARAIARVRLTVSGAPASLALLETAAWDVRLTDRRRRPDDEVSTRSCCPTSTQRCSSGRSARRPVTSRSPFAAP